MSNKTIIRKTTEKGFTQIQNSIINDKRISSTAFRVLMSILSDSDEFTLSETLYCNRLDITEKTFRSALTNLVECGYLKITTIDKDKYVPGIKKAGSNKKVNYYTISEYGNLKTNKIKEEPKEEPKEETPSTPTAEVKPVLNLVEYNDALLKRLNERENSGERFDVDGNNGLVNTLDKAMKEGKLVDPTLVNVTKINKLLDRFKIEIKSEEIQDRKFTIPEVMELCDVNASELTKANLKSLRNKMVDWYRGNTTNNKNIIVGKIKQFKTTYRTVAIGNQD